MFHIDGQDFHNLGPECSAGQNPCLLGPCLGWETLPEQSWAMV